MSAGRLNRIPSRNRDHRPFAQSHDRSRYEQAMRMLYARLNMNIFRRSCPFEICTHISRLQLRSICLLVMEPGRPSDRSAISVETERDNDPGLVHFCCLFKAVLILKI